MKSTQTINNQSPHKEIINSVFSIDFPVQDKFKIYCKYYGYLKNTERVNEMSHEILQDVYDLYPEWEKIIQNFPFICKMVGKFGDPTYNPDRLEYLCDIIRPRYSVWLCRELYTRISEFKITNLRLGDRVEEILLDLRDEYYDPRLFITRWDFNIFEYVKNDIPYYINNENRVCM